MKYLYLFSLFLIYLLLTTGFVSSQADNDNDKNCVDDVNKEINNDIEENEYEDEVEDEVEEYAYEEEENGDEEEDEDEEELNSCRDFFYQCQAWKEDGLCESSHKVRTGCQYSCNTCDEPRCSRNPDELPAYKGNEMNEMFERIFIDENLKRYEPKALSKSPWIVLFDNFLSEQDVNDLLDVPKEWHRSMDTVPQETSEGNLKSLESQHRTSETAFCIVECDESLIVDKVQKIVGEITGIKKENFEFIQFVQYGARQYYKSHHDTNPSYVNMPMGPRILTFFIYLSDVDEGGETHFENLGIKVKSRKGRAVLWQNVKSQDMNKTDYRTSHEALPVIKGYKIAANFWIYLYDYRNPWQISCTG